MPLQPAEEGRRIAAALLEDPAALKAKILAVRARRSGSRSFAAFVKQAWPYVMQVDPLVWSWHMDALCSHFEECARGGIRRLLVNIAPGSAKSVTMSVLWPAWIWTWWPKCQFLFGSYSHSIAERDSLRCRAVIESDWYQQTYAKPGGWSLRHDQNAKAWFVNTLGGERLATGVGGTGRRAHVIGIDDPIDTEERHSKAARDRANDWIGTTLSQRFVDATTGRVAMIMQRLHEEDPSAFVLSAPGWEHLMLPTEFDPDRRAVTHRIVAGTNGHSGEMVREEFWRDPRTERGELLFPQRFPADVIEGYKRANSLGPHGFATLHQQYPHPEEGGIFKLSDWRFWKPDHLARHRLDYAETSVRPRGCASSGDFPSAPLDLDDLDDQIISVDPTFRETKSGSFVAIHVWGRKGSRRPLLYRVKRRMDFTETVAEIRRVATLFPNARRKLIEGKANGDAIISTLERAHGMTGLEAVSVSASKEQRAHAMQPYVTGHNVEIPEGAPWMEDFVSECAAFPNGASDDDVDAMTQGLQGLERARTTMDLWSEALS